MNYNNNKINFLISIIILARKKKRKKTNSYLRDSCILPIYGKVYKDYKDTSTLSRGCFVSIAIATLM